MLNRIGCHDKALSVRHKFNSILEDTLAEKDIDHHYILNVSKPMNDAAYFINDTFTSAGAKKYWMEIDKIIKDYDEH